MSAIAVRLQRVAPRLRAVATRSMSTGGAPLKEREIAAEKQYFNVEDEKLLRVSGARERCVRGRPVSAPPTLRLSASPRCSAC